MLATQQELLASQRQILLQRETTLPIAIGGAEEGSDPFLSTMLKDTVNGLVGNLLTAAVLYLIAVGGDLIKPSITLIVIAVSIASLSLIASFALWTFGAISNNYTRSVRGKRAFLFSVPCLALIFGLIYLVSKAIDLNLT
jgi:hypothetical protein